jgi:hypothetical protein
VGQAANRPAVVLPVHDPTGQLLPHVQAVLPDLRGLFERAFVSVTRRTAEDQPAWIQWLAGERLFQPTTVAAAGPIGHQFRALYRAAALACQPERVLHLCFPDRLAFALRTGHRAQFIEDVEGLKACDIPLLFQRSEVAWRSHPANYREIEGMATRAGELLLGRRLDLTWCHLAVSARELGAISQDLQAPDLSLLAEIVLALPEGPRTREVDWLAWEDPFIAGCDPRVLRKEREASLDETRRRLSYVIPAIQLVLARAAPPRDPA